MSNLTVRIGRKRLKKFFDDHYGDCQPSWFIWRWWVCHLLERTLAKRGLRPFELIFLRNPWEEGVVVKEGDFRPHIDPLRRINDPQRIIWISQTYDSLVVSTQWMKENLPDFAFAAYIADRMLKNG